ncbi:hypothetical protein [Thermithiobacillus plumbiphilus]|uniref:Uncharacterized protein n=1 Tax=Thermithiobacillus plumbiphilus TaxID=1729899 RepID=A0ABU9DBN6_9PROT
MDKEDFTVLDGLEHMYLVKYRVATGYRKPFLRARRIALAVLGVVVTAVLVFQENGPLAPSATLPLEGLIGFSFFVAFLVWTLCPCPTSIVQMDRDALIGMQVRSGSDDSPEVILHGQRYHPENIRVFEQARRHALLKAQR